MNSRQFFKKYKNFIFVMLFFIVVGVLSFIFFSKHPELLKDPEALKAHIESYGTNSMFVFLGLQILQIVIFVIPGEIFQIASGYVFGPALGFVLCFIGSIIGGTIIFYIARIAGRNYIENLISVKNNWLIDKLNKFNNKPNFERRISRDIFLLYLIPGVPKDVLGYICGVTEIGYVHYIIASNLGKIPALFLSTFFGSTIFHLLSSYNIM